MKVSVVTVTVDITLDKYYSILLMLQFSFSILIFFYFLHSLFIVLGILPISSPLTFFLLLDLTLFFYDYSNTSDDITTDVMFDNVL